MSSSVHFIIIGISDNPQQWLSPDVVQAISRANVFSGGTRHHELMTQHLPAQHLWIDVTVPLSSVFEQYRTLAKDGDCQLCIFASGDPLFYGFAGTLQREFPDSTMQVFPSFNSLQLLAHRLCMPYQQMRAVSLTGRPWNLFDEALIRGEKLIGVLTDRRKTPEVIWKRMQEYGYDNYTMYVGERLGNPQERVEIYNPNHVYEQPNCLILQQQRERVRPFGLPESHFALLNGRTKMITKMPIRLCTLAVLGLEHRQSFWDIGFCTGSISIEARLHHPHLHITAFEIRPEGQELMRENCRRFGTPGIDTNIGDFLDFDLTQFEAPDAVFIGGHGGRLDEIVSRVTQVLRPGGCIVFNSVSNESRDAFRNAASAHGMNCTECHRIALDDHNPITILKAE